MNKNIKIILNLKLYILIFFPSKKTIKAIFVRVEKRFKMMKKKKKKTERR